MERLGNSCPVHVFTGIPQGSPLSSITCHSVDVLKAHTIDEVRFRELINIKGIHNSISSMHKDVADRSSKKAPIGSQLD